MLSELIKEIDAEIDPERAESWACYFGMAPGKYGEDQKLLGVSFTTLRKIGKKYVGLSFDDLDSLLRSDVHDFRFVALVILLNKYKKTPDVCKDYFCCNIGYVNNWDLVDSFAPNILGRWCFENHDESLIAALSDSTDLWTKRTHVVSYLYFYRKHVLGGGIDAVDSLLEDGDLLIQKACGWMLREIYDRVDKHLIESYIIDNYDRMPRNCLRNAIEHMPKDDYYRFLRREF